MPCGKAWSKAKTTALVETFVYHISQDEIIDVNQHIKMMYDRVVAEAKTCYDGN